jgi:crotonobetainyl-CoA:carnitine CoA-transferase CaiB-like acyl-CoA transferase
MIPRTFPPLPGDPVALSDVFHTWDTADGHVVGLVIQDSQFHGLLRALRREDLASDARFANLTQRFLHMDELIAELASEMRKWPTAELVARAREHGAPFSPVNDVDAFLLDPQARHRETVSEVEDPRFGTTRFLRHPVRYAATPASLRRHPPRLGEHADELLAEAGFAPEEIRNLRASGALR